jgi:MFS family permease
VLAGAYAAGTLVGALPGGVLAARAGAKATVLIGLGLLSASSVAVGVLGPLRLDGLGANSAAIGATFVVAAAVEGIVSPLIGKMADRRGYLVPVRLGLIGAAICLTVVTLPASTFLLAATIVALAASLGTFWAPAMAMLSDAAEVEGLHQGFAFALVNFAWALGQVAGSGGGGVVAKLTSDALPLLGVGALCLLTFGVIGHGGHTGKALWRGTLWGR